MGSPVYKEEVRMSGALFCLDLSERNEEFVSGEHMLALLGKAAALWFNPKTRAPQCLLFSLFRDTDVNSRGWV